jgi:flagellar biosynthesis/type III secretory pathway chaperone
MKIFNLRQLSELEVTKQYQMKISNRYAAFQNLNDTKDINRAWKILKRIPPQLKAINVCMN